MSGKGCQYICLSRWKKDICLLRSAVSIQVCTTAKRVGGRRQLICVEYSRVGGTLCRCYRCSPCKRLETSGARERRRTRTSKCIQNFKNHSDFETDSREVIFGRHSQRHNIFNLIVQKRLLSARCVDPDQEIVQRLC